MEKRKNNMEIIKVVNNIYRSSLPNGNMLAEYIKNYKLKTVIDLTQRKRNVQENACKKNGCLYKKMSVSYDCCNSEAVVRQIITCEKPLLYFCFHGRDRSGKISRIIKRMHGKVVLYKVGRNLNRVYRTVEAFGIPELQLIECSGEVRGNLYAAKNKIKIIKNESMPKNIIAFETNGKKEITEIDFENISSILIGGETVGIPTWFQGEIYKIPQIGNISGLTVEAALAIILYEWGR